MIITIAAIKQFWQVQTNFNKFRQVYLHNQRIIRFNMMITTAATYQFVQVYINFNKFRPISTGLDKFTSISKESLKLTW